MTIRILKRQDSGLFLFWAFLKLRQYDFYKGNAVHEARDVKRSITIGILIRLCNQLSTPFGPNYVLSNRKVFLHLSLPCNLEFFQVPAALLRKIAYFDFIVEIFKSHPVHFCSVKDVNMQQVSELRLVQLDIKGLH